MAQKKLPLINSAHGSETRNIINELIKLFNSMGYTYDEALQKAHETLNEAKKTNDMNKDVQNQLDVLIIESGNANAEVSQARGGLPLLKDRLNKVDKRLEELSINIMEFEHLKVVRGNGYDWQPVFKAAVEFAHSKGGGKLYAPANVYELYSSIPWETNISLFGAGMGKTILRPIGNNLSAIRQTDETKYNKDNPLEDVMFVDFEIDGTGFTNDTHSMSVKGLFILYMKRALFLNLYIHDTIGTGLGCDFLDQTVIHGCIVENCGRLFGTAPAGLNIGGAGIGIGTGVWETETLTISDCHAINCGSNGIFVEKQGNAPYAAKGIRIVNCTSINNRNNGIEDKGVTGLLVQGCLMQNNSGWGLKINGNAEASEGMILNNIIRDNSEDGVILGQLYKGHYDFSGNRIYRNAKRGLRIGVSGQTVPNISFKDNKIYENKNSGIDFISNDNGLIKNLFIEGNEIHANGDETIARGVQISAHIDNLSLKDNIFFDDRENVRQHRGMRLDSSRKIKGGFITDNVFKHAPLGIELLGETEDVIINNNYGYTTENYGGATFAVGEELINIPHGLAKTPGFVSSSVRGTELQDVWVRDFGVTNIVLKRSDTTKQLNVFWEAKV